MWYSKYMKYVFNAVYTKEGNGYCVLCPELGVATQGKDIKEAEYNIREAVELYIEDLSEEELVAYTQAKAESPILGTFEVIHA
jgi:predicted RNase H-like HicB family nuclease